MLRAVVKRIADFLEKFSVGSFLWAMYREWEVGVYASALALVVSIIFTIILEVQNDNDLR